MQRHRQTSAAQMLLTSLILLTTGNLYLFNLKLIILHATALSLQFKLQLANYKDCKDIIG